METPGAIPINRPRLFKSGARIAISHGNITFYIVWLNPSGPSTIISCKYWKPPDADGRTRNCHRSYPWYVFPSVKEQPAVMYISCQLRCPIHDSTSKRRLVVPINRCQLAQMPHLMSTVCWLPLKKASPSYFVITTITTAITELKSIHVRVSKFRRTPLQHLSTVGAAAMPLT